MLRLLCLATLAFAFVVPGFCDAKTVHVKGYYTKSGTYVAPHYRTSPNNTKVDNYSTVGNTNPYTGKAGTVPLYGSGYSTVPASDIATTPEPLYGGGGTRDGTLPSSTPATFANTDRLSLSASVSRLVQAGDCRNAVRTALGGGDIDMADKTVRVCMFLYGDGQGQ